MGQKEMGYERNFLYGPAGTTAATLLTRARDVTYARGTTNGEVTSGGDGTAPPIETFRVATRTGKVTWNMVRDASDTAITALIAAASLGTPVAIRYIPKTGLLGFDGDMVISVSNGAPYKGEATYDFEGDPNDDVRTPLLNA